MKYPDSSIYFVEKNNWNYFRTENAFKWVNKQFFN